MTDVTTILSAIEQGDPKATEQLLPLVYDELRMLAAQRLSHEKPGQTLQATALVHEAWMRLEGEEGRSFNNREHFFRAAATAMRRILIDNARRKLRVKHGGEARRKPLTGLNLAAPSSPEELLAVDEALGKLETKDSVKAELVKLRFFAGLTTAQAAQSLGVSATTAENDWTYARSWLRLEMAGGEKHPDFSENLLGCRVPDLA